MSRTLYKFFAVAVAISMIIALPAVALPHTAATVSSGTAPAAVAPEVQQAAAVPGAPISETTEVAGEVELPQALKDQTGPVKVVIELADEPAAAIYAAEQAANNPQSEVAAATRAQIARIDAAQETLLSALHRLDATVLYRTQRVYNGIYAIVDADKLNDLAKQSGIKAIHPLVSKSLDNWHSVPLIGAPELWDSGGLFGGLDGTGIKVGIIDSGVDYGHADFGGWATAAAYDANDTTVITDTYNGELLYPTMKVVGGWDFAGDSYDANPNNPTYQPIPYPDPDPAPCYTGGSSADHGTHVAGTTAGYGVNANGSTYTGPYNPSIDFGAFKVGPGVAPMAELYSLRVFGCNGSTDVTDQAIEWATDPNGDGDFSDHLDVINMSLGSSYGGPYDSSAVASDNASLVGVVVVASAGNSGDVYYVVGSPSVAGRAISVAGSDDGAAILDGFEVLSPVSVAGVYPASESVAYNWAGGPLPITGTVVYPLAGTNPAQDQRTGCYTFDITNTQIISGNIVVLDWNAPSCGGSVTRGANAVAAHAIGAIMVDYDGAFDLYITGSPVIPAYSAPASVGNALKAAMTGNTVVAVMTHAHQGSVSYTEPQYQNTVYASSSRGPRRTDSVLKPDITAPAVSVFSALNHSGTAGVSYNGTSMAAPHVAGSMALLKQLHPNWSVEELKSLAMNTATTDVTQANGAPPKYTPARVGAGRITLPNAASSDVIAFNAYDPYLTSISFGAVEVNGTAQTTKLIKVVNKGNMPAKFTVTYEAYATVPGVSYTVTPAMVNLGPNGSTLVSVKMTADAAQMKHTADPTVVLSAGRSWLSEASGYVVLTPVLSTHTVNVTTAGNGSGSVTKDPDHATYTYGDVITLTATPDTGSVFAGWSGDATGMDNPLVLAVGADLHITATFTLQEYALNLATAGNGMGTITKSPAMALYPHGSVVTLTAVPDAQSSFVNWSGDAIGSVNPVVVTMDAAKSVTATFALNFYTLDVTTSGTGTGTVTKTPDQASYESGTVVTLTAMPDATSAFAGWSGDATGTTNPVVVTMDGDKAVDAMFVSYNVYLPLIQRGTATTTQQLAVAAEPMIVMPSVLRIPVHAAPRPASAMGATVSAISFAAVTGTTAIPLAGTPISTGVSYPTDIVSLVSAFELAETSPNDAGLAELNNADLKYVGVTNNNRVASGGFVTNTVLYFGISTWGNHSTAYAADAEFDIYIDRDRNGTWDYVVYNTQSGSDVFVTAVVNLSTGSAVADRYINVTPSLDTYPFNNNVMILPVSASRLGLTNANPRFDYQIVTFSREEPTGAPVDATAKLTYSAAKAGLDFTNGSATGPVWFDLPGTNLNVNFDNAAYQANGSQGVLLLHHHNAAGMREAVINVTPPANFASVSILHHNDFHGQLEASGSNPGYARDVAVIKQVRNELNSANVLLLDAGDEMQGSLLSNLNKGAPVIDLFNQTGVKAATFGNHEFDWGQQALISRTQQANFPYVTANIVVSSTGNCATETGWTTPPWAKPWITTTVGAPGNQVVVGVVGVTTLETPQITIASATQGLCFKEPAQSISHYVPIMKAAGAQVIVVLSHLGYPDGGYGYGIPVYGDQTLARKLVEAGTPANLIIGGHSHTNLATATVISNTTIVQAYYNGRNIGRADLLVNKTTGAVTINWQRISVSTTGSEDAAAKAAIAVWANDPVYQALINQPIGYTQVDLPRGAKTEAMMGNFIDDAIYNFLNTDGNPANDIDLFFNNAGGIRTDWCRKPDPANPGQYIWSSTTSDCHTGVYTDTPMLLTYGNMFTILPFGNATVVGDMTGAQIMEIVNYGPNVSNGVIQPAGLKYKFYEYRDANPGPQPYAWGAYDVTVRNKNTGVYEPLVMTKTYKVGTNEFLAPAGGDGYNGFKYMTNISYWGDMLNAVNAWVTANYTMLAPYKGPNGDGTLDGRLIRNGTDTYGGTATEVVPVTILHHNDSHGRLLPAGTAPGYTNLVTLIRQEQAHNTARTLLLQAGDNIQGDAMDAFYKAAFTGKGSDGTTLPVTLTVNPVMAAFNAMNYDAMTLGNHEFNFGNYIFTGTLGQANFPLLQANLYDNGQYGIAQVNVRPYITKTLPGSAGNGNINLAVLGIGNHRVPQYELPSNIPGLSFTNPITETQSRAPALKATNDVVVAMTHIGFTTNPNSVEVDSNVDTNLAAQTTGVDAIVGSHSHTNPSAPEAPYKFLPTYVGALDNTPVIINQAYRYNTYLGEIVLGLLPKAGGGGYDVVARAGRYIANSTSVTEDPAVKAIVKPYDDFLTTYKTRVIGRTTLPIDTLTAYTSESNGADLQVDASLWKLNNSLPISIDFHLSGAMTNARVAATATATNPYTLTVNDMFSLMPYENSLVAFTLNGPQLKAILERAYRNYWYYKYVPGYGGYSYYPTCNLDISAGGIITYTDDPITYTTSISHVTGLSFGNTVVDFNDAGTYYDVSTVNYVAAGSCNFNNGGVTIWPLAQITYDTQNYVRDVVIEYIPTLPSPFTPLTDNRIRMVAP